MSQIHETINVVSSNLKAFLFLPQFFFSYSSVTSNTKKIRKKRAQGRRRVKERPWIQGKKYSTVVEASLA